MTPPSMIWKNLCLIRDGAADVVSEQVMRVLINRGLVTLGRALTEDGRAALAEGDAAWRCESPPLAPDVAPIRAWRDERVKA
jgi:hypothetical protein